MSKRIVDILVARDGISEDEAVERVQEVKELLYGAEYSLNLCENILANELGLEPDYLLDFFFQFSSILNLQLN